MRRVCAGHDLTERPEVGSPPPAHQHTYSSYDSACRNQKDAESNGGLPAQLVVAPYRHHDRQDSHNKPVDREFETPDHDQPDPRE